MMWGAETSDDPGLRVFDFKYMERRSNWGLNKPAVLTRDDMRGLFTLYAAKRGASAFP